MRWTELKVPELKEHLIQHKLDTKGRKSDLIKRLEEAGIEPPLSKWEQPPDPEYPGCGKHDSVKSNA